MHQAVGPRPAQPRCSQSARASVPWDAGGTSGQSRRGSGRTRRRPHTFTSGDVFFHRLPIEDTDVRCSVVARPLLRRRPAIAAGRSRRPAPGTIPSARKSDARTAIALVPLDPIGSRPTGRLSIFARTAPRETPGRCRQARSPRWPGRPQCRGTPGSSRWSASGFPA